MLARIARLLTKGSRAPRFLAEVPLAVFYALGWFAALVVLAAVTSAAAVRIGWKDAFALTDRKRQESADDTA